MLIAIDFDGTVFDNSEKDSMIGPLKGDPIPGAIEALKSLIDEGHQLVIFTARPDLPRVNGWLFKHGIKIPSTNTKPAADVYIDDKAIHFEDWDQALDDIEELKEL